MRLILILLSVFTFNTICLSQSVLQDRKFTNVTKDNAVSNYGAYASVTVDYLLLSRRNN